MTKPLALTDSDLRDLTLRVSKGWVVRYDQMRALIAMAEERNLLMAEKDKHKQQEAQSIMSMLR